MLLQQLVQESEESEARLVRLQEVAAQSPPQPLPDVGIQVENLQQMVNQLQEERDSLAQQLPGARGETKVETEIVCFACAERIHPIDADSGPIGAQRMDAGPQVSHARCP